MLRALEQLDREGMTFNLKFSRGPFFLKGSQQDIDNWYASMGLPNDAPRWKVAAKRDMTRQDAQIDALFRGSGLSPRNREACDMKVWSETMTAHRLSQYAATESSEKSELFWSALSRRWFMGKDTEIRPIKLNNHEMLLECAEQAFLDMEQVRTVLSTEAFSQEVWDMVKQVHAMGIHSIPFLVFEVDGLLQDTWHTGKQSRYRKFHNGSGDRHIFYDIFKGLDAACGM